MSPQTRCSGENASITARTSLIFWLRLQEHECSDHHHLQGMLLTFSTRHARFNVCIQEGLHSSIYKHVCVSVLLLGPWTAPSVQILLHVAQSTSNIFHFFLYLHSSQLLLRLWIPFKLLLWTCWSNSSALADVSAAGLSCHLNCLQAKQADIRETWVDVVSSLNTLSSTNCHKSLMLVGCEGGRSLPAAGLCWLMCRTAAWSAEFTAPQERARPQTPKGI